VSDDEIPKILLELHRAMMQISSHEVLKRMRFALTEDEYKKFRAVCFDRDGKFFMRFRNVPLIVEAYPDKPELLVELEP
jgi:hypothetical protein